MLKTQDEKDEMNFKSKHYCTVQVLTMDGPFMYQQWVDRSCISNALPGIDVGIDHVVCSCNISSYKFSKNRSIVATITTNITTTQDSHREIST